MVEYLVHKMGVRYLLGMGNKDVGFEILVSQNFKLPDFNKYHAHGVKNNGSAVFFVVVVRTGQ